MESVVVAVFTLTYVGMALGRVPGLRIDRTGIALVAVAVLLLTGAVDIAGAGRAIDGATIVLLFALMVVSAQLAVSGFYDLCVARIVAATSGPRGLLALTVAVAGGLSAVLANDIVVFAMTPLLCTGLSRRGLDPKPYLLAVAGAANAGSAATVIGNPQNILIGQTGHLAFLPFLAVCGVPALAALVAVFGVIAVVYRRELGANAPVGQELPVANADRWQVTKGLAAAGALVVLFATPVPREISAMAVAGALLLSRKTATRTMLASVDWNLLALFLCLFTVTAVFGSAHSAAAALAWLNSHGLRPDRIAVIAPLALAVSNGIGNVPAVILITGFWPDLSAGSLYALALFSTLAGNLLLVGSVANLIVAERTAAAGFPLRFRDFARTGVPITLVSMAFAAAWIGVGGVTPW